ncbi:putative amidoligase enzyme [Methyloligella halotolerans]|uniref:Putative amidoligase enzyme n=1 Tax=Methyloligella halotolerans TaxID=1177755 RepID=A0A1E2S1M8_9HYPH|nr:amidoligase family protein [Methyloligella halotolerans]ODA68239.1 putative amidoligase enzyme [Methyloligella halotolerans]
MRCVGVEIEFGGLDGLTTAVFLSEELGGEYRQTDPFAYKVTGTSLGDFEVMLDTSYAHYKGKSHKFLDEVGARLANLFGAAAELVVPYEIVTPPVPMDRLGKISKLLRRMAESGASGTETSVFFAFGLHLNPEAPSLTAGGILPILKAFALLSPWLWRSIDPDPTRRLLRFAEPYGCDYVRLLADPSYEPELARVIDDYLAHNPTRNRDLDMLPLFAHLDEGRVRARLPNEKINGRPTFHYRLPDAKLGDPGWSFAGEWNRWVTVERLAGDPERLKEAGRAYLAHEGSEEAWSDKIAGIIGA